MKIYQMENNFVMKNIYRKIRLRWGFIQIQMHTMFVLPYKLLNGFFFQAHSNNVKISFNYSYHSENIVVVKVVVGIFSTSKSSYRNLIGCVYIHPTCQFGFFVFINTKIKKKCEIISFHSSNKATLYNLSVGYAPF